MTSQSPAGVEPPLLECHDVLLVDLDGVVYAGARAVPAAVPALVGARSHGLRVAFVTNNASRTPAQVAAQLADLGLPTGPGDVLTSAEAAAEHLARELPTGAPVLVVGGPGLHEACSRCGLTVVDRASSHPVAVVQGFGPDVGWRQLAEAAYAVTDGAQWVATNRDLTFPTDRGVAPGNGTLVAAVEAATGRHPVTMGKPEPALFEWAMASTGARRPLVIGDRLDTDIRGARRAGIPSLLVLTGVTGVEALLAAPADSRPDHVVADLAGLAEPGQSPVPDGPGQAAWRAGGWRARAQDGRLALDGSGDPVAALRCAAAAAWQAADDGSPLSVVEVTALLEAGLPRRR